MIWTIFSFLGPLKESQLQEHMQLMVASCEIAIR